MVQIHALKGDAQHFIVVDGDRELFSGEFNDNTSDDDIYGHTTAIIYLRSGQKMWVDDGDHGVESEAFRGHGTLGISTYFAVTLLA